VPIGILFWVLMLIWFVFGLYWNWPSDRATAGPAGSHVLLFLLFVLVGWKLFGPPLQ
jgi:hypothetical protein